MCSIKPRLEKYKFFLVVVTYLDHFWQVIGICQFKTSAIRKQVPDFETGPGTTVLRPWHDRLVNISSLCRKSSNRLQCKPIFDVMCRLSP